VGVKVPIPTEGWCGNFLAGGEGGKKLELTNDGENG